MKESLLDDIINKYGYRKHTIIAFTCMFFTFLIQGMEFTFFSIYVIPMTMYYNLKNYEVQLISSSMSVFVCLGTFSSGFFSNKYGRLLPIKVFDIVLLISHISMGLIKNVYFFIIIRLIIGYSVGVISPMNYSIFTEYLPLKYRAFFLAFSYIGVNFGEALNSIMMSKMMPNLEIEYVESCILLLSSCIFISTILNFILLTDSPRNLLSKKNEENYKKAFEILDEMKEEILILNKHNNIDSTEIDSNSYTCLDNINSRRTNYKLSDDEKERIIREIEISQIGSDYSESLLKIFNDNYMKTSIFLIGIFFFNYMNEYGLKLIFSLAVSVIKGNHPNVNSEVVRGTKIVYFSMISASIISGVLCEIEYLGRKRTFFIANVIAFMSIIICSYNTSLIFYWFSLCLIAIKISVVTSNLYTAEVYNTLIRNKALGLMLALGRSGAFFSQILFIFMHNVDVFLPFYYVFITCILNSIFSISLPFETFGKKLEECVGEDIELKDYKKIGYDSYKKDEKESFI